MLPPRVPMAIAIVAACIVGAAGAFGLVGLLGGSSSAQLLSAGVVVVSSCFALLPAVGSGRVTVSRWGMLVLMGTMGQTLGTLGVGLALSMRVGEVSRRGFWIGAMAGTVVVLVVHVVVAIRTLKRSIVTTGSEV